MEHVNIHTIGFTKKTAEHFFNALKKNGVIRVIDTRLNNNSQLSGFAKAKDLEFFLRKICNIDYVYRSELAPTKKILDDYKNKNITWEQYSYEYLNLMEQRLISSKLSSVDVDNGCLLCSEDKPHNCHRRLLAEYLKQQWSNQKTDINHIL
ncbi:DUF488 domain-containing protein [Enterobacter hormaechei]|jgi:uncharacterized protein (DUF488 family)|uniref:DUF488 domain-containing protein n=1 Tax=Klebsiella variicola TaxID=244366 RepID=A0A9Q9T0G3_KLEVA|nr:MULTISPECIES: DUF488 domain-containing protein [Enterobacterales]EAW0302820.1 DUF488 domain-containing protein [Salmonella enterica]EBV5998256.1 DUF488 domain-containing protein [Salmonella enterica subsp. enterica serovar Ohio]EKJ6119109.1 DUF488 domain-containing protein [Salmonella enterica subsp. enterica serovar Schwarzengrund]EKN3944631.1 DUF488 domain-containing protein [Yersinia enterocolitica]MBH3264799.1 DUF488 domain-containing protein [Serratia marcescens]HBM0962683.1 DUF488 do